MSQNDEKFRLYICYGGAFEYVNNVPMYMPIECVRIRLNLPVSPEKPMTCKILLKNVLKKLQWPLDSPVCMKYKVDNFVEDIVDDPEDFQEFLNHAISNAPIEIYIVEKIKLLSAIGSNKLSSSSSGFQQRSSSSSGFQQQLQNFQPYDHTPPNPNYQLQLNYYSSPQEQHFQQQQFLQQQFQQQQYQNTQFNQQQYQHTQQTNTPTTKIKKTSSKARELTDEELERHDYQHFDEENVNEPKKTEHPFMEPFVRETVDELTEDEEEEVEEPVKKEQISVQQGTPHDMFWDMPPLLFQNEPEIKPIPKNIVGKSNLVKQGQTFENKEEFQLQLHTKCLQDGQQISVVKSDKKRYTARCKLPDCEWKISAAVIPESENFYVRKLHDEHTHSNTQILGNNKHATKKVLGHILKDSMVQGRIYKGKDIASDMSQRFKVSLSYNQAWRAKCYAIELLRGNSKDSFIKLPLYLHNLELCNPGSRTNIRTDHEDKFLMCYMSIGAAVRTFVRYARPIIIVDGAHLKGSYLGTNLIAVAMDGNNGILPLAYGIGAGETTDHWAWFFGNLRYALELERMDFEKLTIISDSAASIAAGVQSVFPDAFHALCCRHLLGNLKKKADNMKHFEWHYWRMCKAYRKADFDRHYGVFTRRVASVATHLREVGFERWSRHHSEQVRYAYLTSNSAESMNALTVHARKLPVTMLLEFFRASVQQWFYTHHNTAATIKTPVTPYAEHKIGKRMAKSCVWPVRPSTNTIIEVLDGNLNGIVDLERKTCTCMQWQLSGLPCGHVLSVARHFKQNDVSCYVERYFSTEWYVASYEEHISPMPTPTEWVDPGDLTTVLPPTFVPRQAGRPKEHARIPSKGEQKEKSKKYCSRCGEQGHSRAVCSASYEKSNPSTSRSRSNSTQKSRGGSRSKTKVKTEATDDYCPTANLADP